MVLYLRVRYLGVITNSLNLHAFTLEYTAARQWIYESHSI